MVRVQGHAAAAAGRGRAAGRPDAAPRAAHHSASVSAPPSLTGRPAQKLRLSLPPSDGTSRGMGRGVAGGRRARPRGTGPLAQ
ncbi:hypothetical protein E2C01_022185 [Portunus trituberculatus]|uniref:Uncharacterized protein n=1 Tax=Portunus trituberculatus TaxID=210409 RepID=A0A5B7E6C5_PORTR|nr:hypothetical protein [Portunus trituberculatus]